ncbi:MAG: transporter substrate-binding domain-containing protein [Oleispira sp.]|nr:transporter substrate-binding domain-containing protein [Oleispira sp.]
MKVLLKMGLFGLICHCMSPSVMAEELKVIYSPSPASKNDTRFDYGIKLLKHVLEKTISSHGSFKMIPAKGMNVGRAIEFLKADDIETVNVIWTTLSESRESSLRPIRIPIRKGLLGYRIFLIKKQDQAKFAGIQALEELKELRVGQGHIWNDVVVFKKNGFEVVTGANYEGLFRMLVEGRFDYFSRGINEAPEEYESRKDKYPDLFIEDTILLYYPWPKYFFTSKNNHALAQRIEKGLRMMIQDGSFEEIFLEYHEKDIERVNLKSRRLFRIENPLLPDTTPLDQKVLWFDPINSSTIAL